MELFTRLFQRKFPKKIVEFWACSAIFGEKFKKDGHKFAGVYGGWERGKVVPVLYKDGELAYYKVLGWSKYGSGYGDYAGWDDRKQYNLVYSHSVPVEAQEVVSTRSWDVRVGSERVSVSREKIAELDWRYRESGSPYYLDPLLQLLKVALKEHPLN